MSSLKEKAEQIQKQQAADTGETLQKKENTRNRVIIRTSLIGVGANVLLSIFKVVIGALTNSIAIVMDAVNNLSDAAGSVITIVGTKLAGKDADRKHPFGYGRIEYMSAMIISILVLYAGVTAFSESVKKILHPEKVSYTAVSLVIVAVAVVVKIVLGQYVKKTGEKVHSDSLVNSGEDARLDSVISASTLVAALIYMTTGLSLEAWLGAVIALVIIKSGVDMLRETLSELLGERADSTLAQNIRRTVASFPGVQGAYDLVLNNYGPDAWNGSIHIEVPDTFSADRLDELIREISVTVYQKYQVILTAVGIYSVNTRDSEIIGMRKKIQSIAENYPDVLELHGFYADREKKTMRFDIVVSFEAEDRKKVYQDIREAVQKAYPDYQLQITLDTDFSLTDEGKPEK